MRLSYGDTINIGNAHARLLAPQVPVFNPLDPAFIADPYPAYHQLRAAAPVWLSPLGQYVMTRHEDVALVLRDRRFGKNYAEN